MKHLIFVTSILVIILMTACNGDKNMKYPLKVEKPFVTFSKTRTISIEKMELTDSATVLSIHAQQSHGSWISIAQTCKLITDTGTELPVISANGIELDKKFWMPDSGKTNFTLTFGAMPVDAKYFDFIECGGENCFNLYGIYFSQEKQKIKVASEWKNIRYPKNDTLPASSFSEDSTVISGYIAGYRPEMDIPLRLYYAPFGERNKEISLQVDENGKFKTTVCPYMPVCGIIILQHNVYSVILVPGQETSVMIDLAKATDSDYAPDYKGYLAQTQHEKGQILDNQFSLKNTIEYDALNNKPAPIIIAYLNNKLKEISDSIDATDMGKACQQLCKINAETEYLNCRLNFDRFWTSLCYKRANITSREAYQTFMKNLEHPNQALIDSIKVDIPSPNCVNAPYFSLANNIFGSFFRYQKNFPVIKNKQNREIFKANSLLMKVAQGDMLSDDEMKEFDSFKNPSFKKLLTQRIAEKDAKLAALKKNKSAHIHELDTIAPEKVLTTILNRYKGKAVLVDIWATWCGPCRAAHKTILPLKNELKDKDIVFIYLTGTTSPVDKWSEMIPEISGEHYYLTNEQYKTVRKQYESRGVPTYLVFDKTGKFINKSVGYPGNETMKTQLQQALEK